jgi:hypothetical protein
MWKLAIERGPGAGLWILALAAQVSGYQNTAVALFLIGLAFFFFVAPLCHYVQRWNWQRKERGQSTMGVSQFLLFGGLLGLWLSVTVTLGAVAWIIVSGGSLAIPQVAIDDGPLRWFANLEMEGGPQLGRNVFSLTFNGVNGSQKEVALKTANIVSAVNGTKLALEIIAQNEAQRNEVTPIDSVNLIPPGAPVRLVAKFGAPDPTSPGKILGLEPKVFLETWRQFYFVVEDDSRTYRLPYNEAHLMPFFPGAVGPRVTKKATPDTK